MTSPQRTILDLEPLLSAQALERAVAEAQVKRLVSAQALKTTGGPTLRRLLDDGPRFTRSEAERRLLALLRAARLPLPRTNVHIAGEEVDAVWDDRRLVVEVDGYRFHKTRTRFEGDRRKALVLNAAGYEVIRVTWRQLVDEPHVVVATIAIAISREGRNVAA